MAKTIDELERNLIEQAKQKPPRRGRVTIYVDKGLFDEYQAACADKPYSPSRLLEEFMRDYMSKKSRRK